MRTFNSHDRTLQVIKSYNIDFQLPHVNKYHMKCGVVKIQIYPILRLLVPKLSYLSKNIIDGSAIEGIFLGYDNQNKGQRIYGKDKSITICRTVNIFANKESDVVNTKFPNHTKRNIKNAYLPRNVNYKWRRNK